MVEELFEVLEDLFERRDRKGRRKGDRARGDGDQPGPVAPPTPPVFCMDCGAKNTGSGRYCDQCGALLPSPGEEMRCLACNQVVPLTAKFCGRCGSRVAPGD